MLVKGASSFLYQLLAYVWLVQTCQSRGGSVSQSVSPSTSTGGFMSSCCSSWDLRRRWPPLDAPGGSGSPGETSGPEESEGPTVVPVYPSGRAGCKGPGRWRLLLADALESS